MMDEKLKIEIGAIAIVHIFAILVAIVFFMMFYMKANKDHALKAFLVLQVSIIGWMIFKIFKTVSPTETTRWWFIVGYYFCACIFEVAFLEFTYAYYKGHGLKKKLRMVIYIFPVVQFSWILTNPYHYMFYKTYDFWGDSFGKLFYIHTGLVYTFIAVGFYYGYKTFKARYKGQKKWLKSLIALAIIAPLVLNFLFITKVVHRFVYSIGIPVIFDITPIAFVLTTLVFVYATFNHDFINISPIMKHEIVHKLDTPIAVLDSAFDCIYYNNKLGQILHRPQGNIFEGGLRTWRQGGCKEGQVAIDIDGHSLNMFIQEVWTLKETQYLILIHEITDYRTIEKKIQDKQEMLVADNLALEEAIESLKEKSKIGARNYVARELHDIIGHSLVVAIKLLEVCKLYFIKDKGLSRQALNDGIDALGVGITNMEAVASNTATYTGGDLEKAFQDILRPLDKMGIKSQLKFKGAYHNLEENIYLALVRVVSELVTNTLKHSDSKGIFISAKAEQAAISVMVLDNGQGCHNLVQGNGLKGIEERLKALKGHVDFITGDGEGFMTKIRIEKE